MKTEVLTENFKKALLSCEKIAKKSLSLPILQNLLMKTEGTFLALTSTNLETSLVWRVLAKTTKQGEALLPANFLASLISLLKTNKLEFSVEKNNLILTSEEEEFQIQGQNPEDFPIIPKIDKTEFFKISSAELTNALCAVIELPSQSQIKPEISGVLFSFNKKILKIVATDSFRLAEKTISLTEVSLKNKEITSFILPQNSAREILNVFSGEELPVVVYFSSNYVLFETNSPSSQEKIELSSRLIEGQYPNYQEIIPQKSSLKIKVKKEEFLSQIKKAGLFSSKSQEIKLTALPQESKIKIFSQNVETGRNESYLGGDVTGKEMEVSFNFKFLIAGINILKSSEVILDLLSEDKAGVLRPVGDTSLIYILMPIKSSY
ncbi:DNA polymerase III subunit beta [bacterium (Candidatus Gribaldobacteria) CG23_combo_of_CG06-09_8_20_14_all_37_87_8]|uniref:Beta sliding clamp n=2 Tax=Candidatus Gribaldobacteria TaxID=2798536 RepID=A0A2G9ZDZ5_9BACT|nr:MAG: DNA polymerase III subunit beta [bacterium (Candidatus Gribaldobacteria) CG23_combo_of_CG06-09_8_20_14_all_37_87_8]PIR89955.1 MAG: DNA polymerase III subunit beta [bacterium (Candidatus Gribaldobacteria) CG10_big_fil_rev_8_21_14_0_10_37_21]